MWGHLGGGVLTQAIASLGPPRVGFAIPHVSQTCRILLKSYAKRCLCLPRSCLFCSRALFVRDLLLQGGEEGAAGGSARGYAAGSCHF